MVHKGPSLRYPNTEGLHVDFVLCVHSILLKILLPFTHALTIYEVFAPHPKAVVTGIEGSC